MVGPELRAKLDEAVRRDKAEKKKEQAEKLRRGEKARVKCAKVTPVEGEADVMSNAGDANGGGTAQQEEAGESLSSNDGTCQGEEKVPEGGQGPGLGSEVPVVLSRAERPSAGPVVLAKATQAWPLADGPPSI